MTNEEAIVILMEMLSKIEVYNHEEKYYQAIAHVAMTLGRVGIPFINLRGGE